MVAQVALAEEAVGSAIAIRRVDGVGVDSVDSMGISISIGGGLKREKASREDRYIYIYIFSTSNPRLWRGSYWWRSVGG